VSRAFSLPHEHGGYLTLAGATIAGVAVAGAHAAALAVGVVAAAAFFARAPLEQLSRGRAARWDVAALAALAAVALVAAAGAGGWRAGAALGLASLIVIASVSARHVRAQRSLWFETAGMAALGASAGLVAVTGGASPRTGALLAIVLAAHAGVAVPLVRAELRPRERARATTMAWTSLAALAVAGGALVALDGAAATFALLPRTLHAATRLMTPAAPTRPSRVGWRETALLALVVAILVWSVR
jgi:hypothetical protein